MSKVLIVVGSGTDIPIAQKAVSILEEFGVTYDVRIASAHRTPTMLRELIAESDADIFIGIAGMAAALPGVIASLTTKPVIGVPVSGKMTLDAILSIVQMPSGIPTACVGLDRGDNAALLSVEILGINNKNLQKQLQMYRDKMIEKAVKDSKSFSKDYKP
ncbi:MAG: 5-(carboxyamino)imidazole ribonucleotide mutase [archaeon]|nr:5-(carboxyamino)imidazole ribonucleotide mutase [archaeon]